MCVWGAGVWKFREDRRENFGRGAEKRASKPLS